MKNKKTFLVILTVLFSTVLACSTLTGLPEPSAQPPTDTPNRAGPSNRNPDHGGRNSHPANRKN